MLKICSLRRNQVSMYLLINCFLIFRGKKISDQVLSLSFSFMRFNVYANFSFKCSKCSFGASSKFGLGWWSYEKNPARKITSWRDSSLFERLIIFHILQRNFCSRKKLAVILLIDYAIIKAIKTFGKARSIKKVNWNFLK